MRAREHTLDSLADYELLAQSLGRHASR
jgi:hypothetical protein